MRALRGLVVLHLTVVALVFLAQPPKWPALAIAALVFVSWVSLRRHAAFGYGPRALRRLIAHAEGGWTIEQAAATPERAERLPGAPVTSALTIVRFKTDAGRSYARVLVGDEADAESLRRLRARLLQGEPPPATDTAPLR